MTVGGGEIAIVKQPSGWGFLNISDGNANGGGNLQIRGLANGGTAGVNLGQLDLMANSVTVEGALSANGGGGNGVYGNTSSGSAWGGVFTGPVYGVYAYGGAWAGYFDGPVNIARGGLYFPDGSVQTTAAGASSSTTVMSGSVCGAGGATDAWCPGGYIVTGCGYQITAGWNGRGASAPGGVFASGNGCHIWVGSDWPNCWQVQAICLKQ